MIRSAFIATMLVFLVPQIAQATLITLPPQQPSPAIGYWEGYIKLPGMKMPIQVIIEQLGYNGLQGTFSAQGDTGQLEAIALKLPEISFKISNMGENTRMNGRIEGDIMKGRFTQDRRTFPFELKRCVNPGAHSNALSEQGIMAVVGYWKGHFRLPNHNVVWMQVNFEQTADKFLQGAISILGIGIKDHKLVDIAVELPEISFKMPIVPGNPTFNGHLEGDVIKGDLTQNGNAFPFELKRGAKPILTEAVLPNGLSERDITIGNSPFELPGTLTLPAGRGPFPVAIIVGGLDDRDGDGPNGPTEGLIGVYKDLAWQLAEKGIAIIRYDKRQRVYGAKMMIMQLSSKIPVTLNEITIDEAALAVSAALRIPEIDSKKIFVIGHSEGGYTLGRIAEKAPAAAGFVSFAGAADLYGYARRLEYLGYPEEEVKKAMMQEAKVKSGDFTANTPNNELLGRSASFWLDLRGYDAVASLRKSGRPALILQGEADYNVTMEDFDAWKKGFPEAAFKSFPKLDHDFREVEAKSTPAEFYRPGRKIDPDVAKTIADWINGVH